MAPVVHRQRGLRRHDRSSPDPRRERGRDRLLHHLPWLSPPVVVLLAAASATRPAPELAGVVGLGVAFLVGVLVYRGPLLGLKLIVVLLPVQVAVIAALYRLGLPAGTLRTFGYWKELAVVALVVTAVQGALVTRRRIDVLDALALAFVALGTVYLLVPEVVVFDPVGRQRSFLERLAAWRTDVLFVGLFLVARHLRPTEMQVRAVLTTALRAGLFLAAVGVFELVASDLWNAFAVDVLHIQQARLDVLQTTRLGTRPDDIRVYGTVGGAEIVRGGGPLFDYLAYSFLMATTVALAAEHLIRRTWRRASLLCALAAVALLATQTRSAIVAACVAFALIVLPRRGVPVERRARFAAGGTVVLLLAMPLALASGLADRFTVGDQSSDATHSASIDTGIDVVFESPLGRGLATGAGTAQTQQLADTIVIENQYLTTASQLGIAGMVLQAGFLVTLAARLHRCARRSTGTLGLAAGAVRGAMVAVLLIGWYLVPFASLALSWGLMVLAGLTVGLADGAGAGAPTDSYPARDATKGDGYGGPTTAHAGRA